MRFDSLYLSLAVVFLWLPLAALLGRRVRRELRNPARGSLVTLPALLRSPWAWFDLLRAGGGLWLLLHHVVLPALPTDKPPTQTMIWALRVAVPVALLLGVWIQTMITGSRRLRLAPLFYLLGITVVLLRWQVWLFGGLLGFTLTAMLRRWQLVFWLLPATLIAAAALFRMLDLSVAIVAVLYVLPGLLGLRPQRPLAWIFSQAHAFQVEKDKPQRRHHRHDRRSSGAGSQRSAGPDHAAR